METVEDFLSGKKISSNAPIFSTENKLYSLGELIREYADQFKNPPKKTIEERKRDFWRGVCNVPGEFTDALVLGFYEYWTEHSEGAKKMRFEKEKVFDIKKRLDRWKRNQKTSYGKSTKPSTDEAVNGFISQ